MNSVMIGAAHALARSDGTCQRVAIFDFDVHHGNGTAEQAALREDGNVLYLSTHQVRPRLHGNLFTSLVVVVF